jgi:hypothetical protein
MNAGVGRARTCAAPEVVCTPTECLEPETRARQVLGQAKLHLITCRSEGLLGVRGIGQAGRDEDTAESFGNKRWPSTTAEATSTSFRFVERE